MHCKWFECMTCTESAYFHLEYADRWQPAICCMNPYADRDIIRISEVFILRHIQTLHLSRVKNCPRVKCRRVSANIGVIYRAAYGSQSRRVYCPICLNVLRQLIQLQCDKLVCALCLVEWRFMLSLLLQPYSTRVHTNKPSVQNNSAPAEWCDGAVCSM